MQITAITAQKKKHTRANIFIDGSFSFSLDYETVLKHTLAVGQTLTQQKRDKLVQDGNVSYWYNACLQLVSRRPRSVFEIQTYLRKKSCTPQTCEKIIKKLCDKKLLNDTEFAQWFITQRITFRPKGKRVLAQELRAKGIAPESITAALESTQVDEGVLAQQIVAKKMPLLKKYPPQKKREKLTAYLARRGFSWDVITSVLTIDE